MIPKMLKARMIGDTVVVKATEPTSSFDAFIMITAGLYYFLKHHPKTTISTATGGSILALALSYLIQHFIIQ